MLLPSSRAVAAPGGSWISSVVNVDLVLQSPFSSVPTLQFNNTEGFSLRASKAVAHFNNGQALKNKRLSGINHTENKEGQKMCCPVHLLSISACSNITLSFSI